LVATDSLGSSRIVRDSFRFSGGLAPDVKNRNVCGQQKTPVDDEAA
jgi:hypothetical protein